MNKIFSSSILKALPAALVLALTASAATAGVSAIDFGGYFRSGLGTSSKGGKESCFGLSGAGSKFRLGNECETYGELALGGEAFKGQGGFSMRVNTRFAYVLNQNSDFETFAPAFREANVVAENIGSGAFAKAKAWVGKRFYERNDVHITDFYFLDTSGPGAGIENIDVGTGKIAYAIIRQAQDRTIIGRTSPAEFQEVLRHDFRWSGLKVNPGGELLLGLVVNQKRVNAGAGGVDIARGTLASAIHTQGKFFGGFNKVALQYATGSQAGGGAGGVEFGANKDDTMARIVEQFVVEPAGTRFSAMGTFVYQVKKDGISGDKTKWTSIGARPQFHFADNLSLAAEIGYDQVNQDGQPSRHLTKFTIAPQISAGNGFWSRPVLRAYYTYAKWNGAAQAAANPGSALSSTGAFGSDTNGSTVGFQAEIWW
jgi:maltoporin